MESLPRSQIGDGADLDAGRGRHLGERLPEPVPRRPEPQDVAFAIPLSTGHPEPQVAIGHHKGGAVLDDHGRAEAE